LPETFWCFDPLGLEPAVNPLPAESAPDHAVTFGCLNNFTKVNEQVLALWASVLSRVKDSRMMILCAAGAHQQRTLEYLRRLGIAAERIRFVPNRPRAEYLLYYHEIDIGLDTLPYNGHSTSLDSYWMGVPVVTLVGQTVAGRAGLSQLTNLGLGELIARTPEEYVEIASGLADDLPQLSALRATLRQRMRESPLMNARRFALNIEAAYRRMWRAWCMQASGAGGGC
jgi:predicted O-linked N-acetylglucosamine transferase (SPINDLY family)